MKKVEMIEDIPAGFYKETARVVETKNGVSEVVYKTYIVTPLTGERKLERTESEETVINQQVANTARLAAEIVDHYKDIQQKKDRWY